MTRPPKRAKRTAGEAAGLTFVLGGARSGKSRYAESLVTASPPPWTYVATAVAGDGEMAARIAAHERDAAKAGARRSAA